MTYVPLNRAQHLLYENGELDPRLVQLEVKLYQESAKSPALYLGYFKDEIPCVEGFKDADEATKRMAELKENNNELEISVVDGLKR